MDLIEWLTLMGTTKVAGLLGVSTVTICQWKKAETSPQVMMADKIIALSNGLVTWESVYAPYVSARKNKDPNQIDMNFKR